MTRSDLTREYLAIVDSIHGCYLDAITGFYALIEEYDEAKQQMREDRPHIPAKAFDKSPFTYSTGHPQRPDSRVVHACSQGEYRSRNEEGGRNHLVMGQVCLVQIYGYWDDCYRAKLATSCGKETNDLKLDIMGDIRFLRNSIVHHRGVAVKDVERCVILKWFKEGDSILLTPVNFEDIISRVRNDLPSYIDSL